MSEQNRTVLLAGAVRDAAGVDARPGAVLVDCGKVVAAGPADVLPPSTLSQARRIDLPGKLLLPAMVNAHTHLQLDALGPRPYDPAGGFVGWVKMLRAQMPMPPATDAAQIAAWITASTRAGARASREAGVQAVGDIGLSPAVAEVRRAAGLSGVTYIEGFGLGPPFDAAALAEVAEGRDGLQPHAPYSSGPALYAAAGRSGRPVSTHLAETLEEYDFVARGRGPKLAFVRELGVWRDGFAGHFGQGLSPVQWMRPHLEAAAPDGGWLVAHCNYVSDADIELLARTKTSVAYCPIASEYFGHPHAGRETHRYRDMLAAGVNVCLGTDSVVCQPPRQTEPQPMGILPQMRRLYRRDGTDPAMLLSMATCHGAQALRLADTTATLRRGASARFALVDIDTANPDDALQQALQSDHPVEPLDFI